MRVVGLIQARMNSTRLPGKVVREISGLPLIVHIYRRLLACRGLDEVRVAPGPEGENPIFNLCCKYGMATKRSMFAECYKDSDLIGRYKDQWMADPFDAFVRITADCLFHDPAKMDEIVSQYRKDYPRNRALSTWPHRLYSEGLDCEVWSTELLMELDRTPECPREGFATWAINQGKCLTFSPMVKENAGEPHLSIDTPQDFSRAEKMLKILGNDEWRYEKTLEAYRKVMAEE